MSLADPVVRKLNSLGIFLMEHGHVLEQGCNMHTWTDDGEFRIRVGGTGSDALEETSVDPQTAIDRIIARLRDQLAVGDLIKA